MNNTSVLVTSVSKTKTLSSSQQSFLPLTVRKVPSIILTRSISRPRWITERRQLQLVEYRRIIYVENWAWRTERFWLAEWSVGTWGKPLCYWLNRLDRSIRPLFLNGYVYDTQVSLFNRQIHTWRSTLGDLQYTLCRWCDRTGCLSD